MDKAGEMRVFTRVVDGGSFAAAARQLGLTPSAVSKLVSRLEDRLGTRLLTRTTRRLALTEEGRDFHARCVRILADIEEAEQALRTRQGVPAGTLHVNATVAFADRQVLPLLPEFLARYPELRVDLRLTDRTVDMVEEGVDVAIRLGDERLEPSLVARRIGTNRRVICAAPDYLARHGLPETPEALREHNCMTLTGRAGFNDWEFADAAGSRVLSVGGNLEANHGDALYHAVLAGIGLARLATYLVGPDIRAGRLVQVLPDYVHEQTGILVVYPDRRHLPAKVRAFVDYLVEKFLPVAPWERGVA